MSAGDERTTRVPRRHHAAPSRTIDGAAVLIQTRLAEVSMLDEVGTHVWARIDGKTSEAELVRSVVEEFEVEPARAADDVRAFLDDLAAAELVEFTTEPSAHGERP